MLRLLVSTQKMKIWSQLPGLLPCTRFATRVSAGKNTKYNATISKFQTFLLFDDAASNESSEHITTRLD